MRRLLTALATCLLTGCAAAEQDKICTPAPLLEQSLKDRDQAVPPEFHDTPQNKLYFKTGQQEVYVLSCIQRWSYRLAKSSDPADVAARAAVGGCYEAINYWNNAVSVYEREISPSAEPKVISDRTGQWIRVEAANREKLHDYALFYVVQARAGKCALN